MKQVLKKSLIIIPPIALLIVMGLVFLNRIMFGVWNPLSLPDRIECYNRRYYISSFSPKILTGDEKPVYSIRFSDNVTGKDLYTIEPKGELLPTFIYLKMKDDKYQLYVLSGGP